MKLSIEEIANVFQSPSPAYRHIIRYVSIDSRQIAQAKQTLFFALQGSHTDGHKYVEELYKKGVRNFVVRKIPTEGKFGKANFIVVPNGVKALQKLAIYYRKNLDATVIGITGSNGKTVVKEWLATILSQKYKTAKNPKSFNSQIGVPLSIFQIDEDDKYAILEAGISKRGEMQKLQKMIRPDIGILTNIGSAHDEGFVDKKNKTAEKLKLFKQVKQLVFCGDQRWVRKSAWPKKMVTLDWTRKKSGYLSEVEYDIKKEKTNVRFRLGAEQHTFEIPFSDDASLENCMQCITIALAIGLPTADIQTGLDALFAVEMRLQMLAGENQCILINDAYTADVESLIAGLEFQKRQHAGKRKTVILSDLLQTGKGTRKLYAQIADLLIQHKIEKVIGIGNEVFVLDEFLGKKTQRYFYQNTSAYLRHQEHENHINEIILVKGARRYEFETIIDQLAKRRHEASLQVDLSAMMHNVHFFRNQLQKKTKILAMIKASGYGSGAIQIAGLLEKSKVDYFGVAYVDEGVTLRKKGIVKPILVLNSQASSFNTLIKYNLEPELFSLSQLRDLVAYLRPGQSIKVHLKVDTGMHRLGYVHEELEEMTTLLLQAKKQIKVQSIFTHLAASDVSTEDPFSKGQMKAFDKAYKYISKKLQYKPDRHALNTSGILRFPQYQHEMVRLGLGLYGIDPSNQVQSRLQEVLSFKASISQIKHLSSGATVGYNRMGRVKNHKIIAIINVGYADGLLRKAGNGRFKVLVNGELAPTIGNICMDMCMVDISKIANVEVNTEVTIFGKGHSVQHLCKTLDTIPYEVYTSISERIKRVYYLE